MSRLDHSLNLGTFPMFYPKTSCLPDYREQNKIRITQSASATYDLAFDYNASQQYDFKNIRKDTKDFSVQVQRIGDFNLANPLSIIVQHEDGEYIAKSIDLPEIYGCGDTSIDALEMLKDEILSIYADLEEDDNFTSNWISVKKFLKGLFLK